jgi:hypothetical protein
MTYADPISQKCLLACPKDAKLYADNNTNTCTALCPGKSNNFKGTYADDSTKTCVFTCPSLPLTFA